MLNLAQHRDTDDLLTLGFSRPFLQLVGKTHRINVDFVDVGGHDFCLGGRGDITYLVPCRIVHFQPLQNVTILVRLEVACFQYLGCCRSFAQRRDQPHLHAQTGQGVVKCRRHFNSHRGNRLGLLLLAGNLHDHGLASQEVEPPLKLIHGVIRRQRRDLRGVGWVGGSDDLVAKIEGRLGSRRRTFAHGRDTHRFAH